MWISDGTVNGTRQLQDIAAGSGSSTPDGFTIIGNTFFFSADDGVTGRELWTFVEPAKPVITPTASPSPTPTVTPTITQPSHTTLLSLIQR